MVHLTETEPKASYSDRFLEVERGVRHPRKHALFTVTQARSRGDGEVAEDDKF